MRSGDAPIRRNGPPRHRSQSTRQARFLGRTAFLEPAEANPIPAISPLSGRLPQTSHLTPRLTTEAEKPTSEPKLEDVAKRAISTEALTTETVYTLAEQPTSRHCSTDESVVTNRRCQRLNTRSFHGLCFLYKVFHSPPSPEPCQAEKTAPHRGATGPQTQRLASQQLHLR